MVILNVNNVVQVTPVEHSLVNVKYHGCIGFIKSTTEAKSIVAFYTPMVDDESAYVDEKEFENLELSLVGVPTWNPN